MIGFNPSIVHVLLYGALEYGNSFMCPNLGNLVGPFIRLLIFFCFLIAYYYFITYYIIFLFAIFILVLVIFIFNYFLRLLIASQSVMKGVYISCRVQTPVVRAWIVTQWGTYFVLRNQ